MDKRRDDAARQNLKAETQLREQLDDALRRATNAEGAVREKEDRYRLLLDSIDIGFCIIEVHLDANGRAIDYTFLELNPAFERQTGLKDAVGKSARTLVPNLEQHWFDTYGEVAATGKPARFENSASSMQDRYYDVHAFRIGDPAARQVAILFRDISHRRRIEIALRESESLMRTVANEARVGLVMVNKERRFLFANQTHAEILGLENADLAGKPVAEMLGDAYQEIEPRLEAAFRGDRVSFEVSVAKHPMTGERRFYELLCEPRALDTPQPYVVIVIVDITERKRVEQNLEELVSERTAKLQETIQELEAFSYSIAHDMRAPLRSMHGFANLVVEDYANDIPQEAQEYLKRIASSASRLDKLIQDVLSYSRIVRQELRLQGVDTDTLVREIVQTYPQLHAPGVKIEIEGTLPKVMGNVAALTQVFSNLLGNGVKFVAPGVAPHVRVRAEIKPCTLPKAPGSGCVLLWFEDNGIGIPLEWQPRIYGMFNRLNPPGAYEGTGIGLAIVKKAVERMGGRVGVQSEVGRGSRFWVELKLAAD